MALYYVSFRSILLAQMAPWCGESLISLSSGMMTKLAGTFKRS